MSTINTLIVDDEALARRGLQMRLDKHEDVKVVGQCSNGREAPCNQTTEFRSDPSGQAWRTAASMTGA